MVMDLAYKMYLFNENRTLKTTETKLSTQYIS